MFTSNPIVELPIAEVAHILSDVLENNGTLVEKQRKVGSIDGHISVWEFAYYEATWYIHLNGKRKRSKVRFVVIDDDKKLKEASNVVCRNR